MFNKINYNNLTRNFRLYHLGWIDTVRMNENECRLSQVVKAKSDELHAHKEQDGPQEEGEDGAVGGEEVSPQCSWWYSVSF